MAVQAPAAPAAPTSLRLISPSDRLLYPSDLEYQGCFRLPTTSRYDFPPKGMCYYAAHDSLFVPGFTDDHGVGEVSIVAPVLGASSLSQLNRSVELQAVADPSNGSWLTLNNGSGINMGCSLVHSNRLIFDFYRFYDGDGTQPTSHWSRNLNLSLASDYVGPVTLAVTNLTNTTQPHAGNVSGYMGDIPVEWQAAFRGPCFTGQCGISIVSRTSLGPGLFAFSPADIGVTSPVPTTPLVFYPSNHPTLGEYGNPAPNHLFNGTLQMGGAVMPDETSAVLFFGFIGVGAYAYGNGTPDMALNGQPVPGEPGRYYVYDPVFPTPGDHAYPYEARVWAYDAHDLALVAAGTLQPWEPVPYATWAFHTDFESFQPRPSGVAYNPSAQKIYVTQTFGDGDAPLVHVWKVKPA